MGGRDISAVERSAVSERASPLTIVVGCALAWLLPGAGHFYLGKRTRAFVFFGLIMLSFVLGFLLDGRFSVVDPRQPFLSSMQVVACLGTGPVEIVARTLVYGAPSYRMPAEDSVEPGESRRPISSVARILRARTESYDSSYGTAYLWAAGLMNMLLILDVFDIGIGRKE